MIKYIFIVFFLILTELGYSQTNSLIGKWQIVAINNGEVYYNFETDSISVMSDDLKEMYSSDSNIGLLKQNMKMLYEGINLEFKSDSILKTEFMPGFMTEEKYKIDTKQSKIITNSKNLLNEGDVVELPYKLIDSRLYLDLKFIEELGLLIMKKL